MNNDDIKKLYEKVKLKMDRGRKEMDRLRKEGIDSRDIHITICGKADTGKSDFAGLWDYPRPPPPKRKCRHGKKWRVNVSMGNMAGINSFRCLKCNRIIMGAEIMKDKKGLSIIEMLCKDLRK